jgi:hypothetical protein
MNNKIIKKEKRKKETFRYGAQAWAFAQRSPGGSNVLM